MKIVLHKIPVRDVVKDYKDLQEEGVFGYGGRLDIRPPYQREFVYKDKQREAVIRSIRNNFPLNVMYWVVNRREVKDENGSKHEEEYYEVLDGQQRIISICQYVHGDFSIDYRYFHNLTDNEKNQILDYELMVYFCEGTDKEKLDWFKTINIAGVKLTEQELRNAVYAGPWLSDAKRYFSKPGCPAYEIAKDYVKGAPIRQEFLETALKWIIQSKDVQQQLKIDNPTIEDYMAAHQHDPNAAQLWRYFQDVITWVQTTFTIYRKEMKQVDWGYLYANHSDKILDTDELEQQISNLMKDDEVTKKSGIYYYIFDGNEKHLNLRTFTESQKRTVYERQQGICAICGNHFEFEEMEADHITPWSEGGKTEINNCQMLCKQCNREKSNK